MSHNRSARSLTNEVGCECFLSFLQAFPFNPFDTEIFTSWRAFSTSSEFINCSSFTMQIIFHPFARPVLLVLLCHFPLSSFLVCTSFFLNADFRKPAFLYSETTVFFTFFQYYVPHLHSHLFNGHYCSGPLCQFKSQLTTGNQSEPRLN